MPFDATGHQEFNDRDILSALHKARDGIALAWCQKKTTDGHGQCAFGWLRSVTHSYRSDDIAGYITTSILVPLIQQMTGQPDLASFNDSHTQAEVLALFDLAIEQVETRTVLINEH